MSKFNFWNYAVSKVFGKQIEVIAESKADDYIQKALGDNVRADQRSWLLDILNAQTAMGFKENPAAITYNTLRKVSRKNPIIAAIIGTRINQVCSFSKQVDVMEFSANKPIGFKVVHKRKHREDMNEAEKKFANELEDFITYCGYTDRFRTGRKRDNFTDFLRKVTRDRLVLDQMCFERVLNKAKEPAEIFAVDAATIRLASEESMNDGVGYCQVVQGQVVNEYTWAEMAFCINNPVSDINQYGYGFSELEQLISVVTALFYSDTYNTKFFSQGLGAQGILNIVTKDGAIPTDLMEAFRSQFQATAAGAANAWKTPIMNADKLDWINLKQSNKDMEFVKWVEYLIKLACAIYQISPEEINFETRGSGSSSMFESNPEGRLKYSKDKGLRPLLTFLSDHITEHFVEPYSLDYMMIFTGLDEKEEKDAAEIRKIEVESYKTLDEVRAEAQLDPLGEENGGNLVLNPQYITHKNQQAMIEQQKEMQASLGSGFSSSYEDSNSVKRGVKSGKDE